MIANLRHKNEFDDNDWMIALSCHLVSAHRKKNLYRDSLIEHIESIWEDYAREQE